MTLLDMRRHRFAVTVALWAVLGACTSRPAVVPETPPPIQASVPDLRPDSVYASAIAPGVSHRAMWYAEGPWSIHVIEIDPTACGVEFRTVKALDRVIGRETTSSMAGRAGAALGRPILVAVNADFFNFDPPGQPEGPQISAGEVVTTAGTRRAALESKQLDDQPVFAVTETHTPILGYARLSGTLRTPAGASIPFDRTNAPAPPDGIAIHDRWWGDTTPADSGVIEVIVRRIARHRAVGDTIRAIVISIDSTSAGVAIGSDVSVVSARGSATADLRDVSPGDTIAWYYTLPGIDARVVELIGGYPMLLENGGDSHAVPGILQSFANSRHPRAVIGIDDSGKVVIVVVDGRQPGFSVGLSLAELADYVRSLGISNALNLDGGGSTTLVIRDSIVNRPSDAAGERAVANALLILGGAPGTCSND